MAKTSTVLNGTDLGVYTGSSPTIIGAATSCQITQNRDMRDTSNKDSSGWKKVLPGQKSWTVSTDGLYIPGGTNNYYTLYTAWAAGTALTLTWKSSSNASDYSFSGVAYITSISLNGPLEGNATYSVTFQGDGAITPVDPGT